MTDGAIPLDEANRRAKARNQGTEPDPGFDESNPPPPTGPEDYGVDASSAGESWTEPDDVDSIYGHTQATCEPNGDDAAPLGDPFHKLPAPPLPRGLLPPILEAFAEREARIKGVEFAAPAMAGLTVCAAAIPDHVRLRVKVHEPWQESARLWLALIGQPSARKSPVIRTAMQPMKHLEKVAFARWRQAKDEWDKAPKDDRGPEPIVRRYILNDTTIESAGRILAENPQGLLLERDELAGWFGSMDKYSGGRGAAADRGFWLQAWNGGPYTVDRISRATCHIPNLSVSIIGGVQPDAIRRVVADAVDDGLLQRLIPISIGPAGAGEDSPDVGHVFRDYSDLVHRLAELPAQNIVFNAEAQEIRRSFERRAQDLVELEALSPQLAAFCGKLDGLFARLALTLHCCDSQPPGDQINADVAARVTQLMRATIIPHALRFYLDSETGILADARSIAGWILGKKVERLTFGDLTTSVRPCRGKSRDEVCRMLEPLEMFNWIFPDDLNHPRAWAVNLQVHERFADRAEQERGRRERMRDLLKESASHE